MIKIGDTHTCTIRVYIEDVDSGNVVYYANYLKFAERGRSEFLRARHITQRMLLNEHGLLFVVRRLNADYARPARLDDLLTLETTVQNITGATLVMEQRLWLAEDPEQRLLFSAVVHLACMNTEGQVQRLPRCLFEGDDHSC
jgi:acyl-CoA thioester hydrolase